MVHSAAYPDDDPSRYAMRRRPARRASSGVWALRITTTCLCIAGAMVIADLALSWSRALVGSAGRTADPTPVTLFVGNTRLSIPANMFRFENERNVGPHDRVELAVHWPTLRGYEPSLHDAFQDASASAPVVYVTIRRRDTATDSAGRLANIYQHFFEPGSLPAPAGLIGHTLSADSGLAGEEVYFEAGATEPFTAHCLVSQGDGVPMPCLSEIHAGSELSVQIRFRKGLLPAWSGIKNGARVLLMSFGATS